MRADIAGRWKPCCMSSSRVQISFTGRFTALAARIAGSMKSVWMRRPKAPPSSVAWMSILSSRQAREARRGLERGGVALGRHPQLAAVLRHRRGAVHRLHRRVVQERHRVVDRYRLRGRGVRPPDVADGAELRRLAAGRAWPRSCAISRSVLALSKDVGLNVTSSASTACLRTPQAVGHDDDGARHDAPRRRCRARPISELRSTLATSAP